MESTHKGNVICLKTQDKLITVRNGAQGWMYDWDYMEFGPLSSHLSEIPMA